MKRFSTIGSILGVVSIVALALAGFFKLVDLPAFAASLDTFVLLPVWTRSTAVVAVPLLEFVPLTLLMAGPRRRTAAEYSAFLVATLIASVVLWHLLNNHRPNCNCYGKLLEWLNAGTTLNVQAWTAASLAAAAAVGSIFRRSGRTTSASAPPVRRAAAGFTVVELLVAVLIVSVLLALAWPALALARRSTRASVTLARLRSGGQLMQTYAIEARDAIPFYLNPSKDVQTVGSTISGLQLTVPQYFAGMSLWRLALADRFFEGVPRDAEMSDARSPANDVRAFLFPCTYAAHPDYWTRSTREGRNQWMGVRTGDAITPDRKSLLVSSYPFSYRENGTRRDGATTGTFPVPICFLDGHAEAVSSDRIRPGMYSGDGTFSWCNWHPVDAYAALHTLSGVRGADVP